MDSKKTKYICSLGLNCHIANMLKNNNLKLESHPFDWVASSPNTIINCLNDNFNSFLNKSNYYEHNNNIHHLEYSSLVFNHYNPLNNENDYNYYKRCIDRFNNLLKQKEHKLFIILFINQQERISKEKENEISNLNDELKKHTDNYTLLCINHYPNRKRGYKLYSVDNIDFLELCTISKSEGLRFINESDNIYLYRLIMHRYNI